MDAKQSQGSESQKDWVLPKHLTPDQASSLWKAIENWAQSPHPNAALVTHDSDNRLANRPDAVLKDGRHFI